MKNSRISRKVSLIAASIVSYGVAAAADLKPLIEAEGYLRDMGRIEMGSPLLISAQKNFAFDTQKTAKDFFEEAQSNLQGASFRFTQSQLSLAATGSIRKSELDILRQQQQMQKFDAEMKDYEQQLEIYQKKEEALLKSLDATLEAELAVANTNDDPVLRAQAVSAAYKKYHDSLQATKPTRPTPPTLTNSSGNNPPASVPDAKDDAFSSNKFTAPGKLLSDKLNVKNSSRQALITAAGDVVTHGVFKSLGDTSLASQFHDQRAFFGFTTVSVTPGRRTQKGYSAQISAQASVEYGDARKEVLYRMCAKGAVLPHKLTLLTRLIIQEGYTEDQLKNILAARGLVLNEDLFKVKKAKELLDQRKTGDDLNNILKQLRTISIPDQATLRSLMNAPPDDLPPPNEIPISVTVLGPLNETENFDQSESIRRQIEFALQLAGSYEKAGQSATAASLLSYAKRFEEDTRIRRVYNAITSFSGAEGNYGFEIGPRPLTPKALTQPKKAEIQRHTFPALLLFKFGNSGTDARIVQTGGVLALKEPILVLSQQRRWIRGKQPWFQWFPHKTLSVREQYDLLISLEKESHDKSKASGRFTASRSHDLLSQLGGKTARMKLPVDRIVEISEAPPAPLRVERLVAPTKQTLNVDPANDTLPIVLLANRALEEGTTAEVRPLNLVPGTELARNNLWINGRLIGFDLTVRNLGSKPLHLLPGFGTPDSSGATKVYHQEALTLVPRAVERQPQLELQTILLPREISLKGGAGEATVVLQFNRPYPLTGLTEQQLKERFVPYPKSDKLKVNGRPTHSGNAVLMKLKFEAAPLGGAIAIQVTLDDGRKVFSQPIAVHDK